MGAFSESFEGVGVGRDKCDLVLFGYFLGVGQKDMEC